jgi:ADP-heptose:LPS heptosyltransferase
MIIISPYAKALRNGNNNAKNYPFWKELISLIDDDIVQVGVTGEIPLVDDFRPNLNYSELCKLIRSSNTWISVDSYFQHLGWDIGCPGIVLWGTSDPNIFGHPENTNLIKDRKYLRGNQFLWWEYDTPNEDCWVLPDYVNKYVLCQQRIIQQE